MSMSSDPKNNVIFRNGKFFVTKSEYTQNRFNIYKDNVCSGLPPIAFAVAQNLTDAIQKLRYWSNQKIDNISPPKTALPEIQAALINSVKEIVIEGIFDPNSGKYCTKDKSLWWNLNPPPIKINVCGKIFKFVGFKYDGRTKDGSKVIYEEEKVV